jgi:hypothetical protein
MSAVRRVTAGLLVVCAAAWSGVLAGSDASVEWHVVGIHGSPPPPFTLDPPAPTTTNTVKFIAATDGKLYINYCYAARESGNPGIDVDSTNRIITVSFSPVTNFVCPLIVILVSGVDGEFGPLRPGDWTFNILQYSYNFTVTDVPLTLSAQPIANSSMVELDWPVSGDTFLLESNDGLLLGNWGVVTNTPTIVSNRNVVQIATDADSRFFRLHRLP